MIYFKAKEIENKPFIQWESVAFSLEELQNLGLENDPLIKSEDEIPDFIYGICPLKIVDGALVLRSETELNDFETSYLLGQNINTSKSKLFDLNSNYFEFDGKVFPMYEAARLHYAAIDKIRGNHKVLTFSGGQYSLIDSGNNINDFMSAYFSKLLLIIQPDI